MSLELLRPLKVWSRTEVLARPSPIPASPGVYAWWFREIPPGLTTDQCLTHRGLTLLYVGISPKRPSANGKPSTQTLRTRVRYHYRGNAEGSTLRLTLGCLLAERLQITLHRVGSGHRMTFGEGEEVLSAWMQDHAFVSWVVTREPWNTEAILIASESLPLNIDQNKGSPSFQYVRNVRREAKEMARSLPIRQ
jgi:hypothetical protein